MRIAVHSDLHLEGGKLPLHFLEDDNYDVLVLAGDIVNSRTPHRLEAVATVTGGAKPILYIPGNHEYYGSSFDAVHREFSKECDEFGITFGERFVKLIDDTYFICCTGWSDLNAFDQYSIDDKKFVVQHGINDFRLIRDYTVDAMIERAKADYTFLRENLERCAATGLNMVVVTHFAPTEYHGNENFPPSEISAYFSNAWEDLMYDYCPQFWIYGHTHGSVESRVYRTRVVCNQKGYGLECSATYNPNKIIEVSK